jgi:hypothetical protein
MRNKIVSLAAVLLLFVLAAICVSSCVKEERVNPTPDQLAAPVVTGDQQTAEEAKQDNSDEYGGTDEYGRPRNKKHRFHLFPRRNK